MPRCASHRLALLLIAPLFCTTAAQAQVSSESVRRFPATALRGVMTFGTPPAVQLNNSAAQLAPGARIRNTGNLQVLSTALTGSTAVVNYTTDLYGQPLLVWILTDAERAKQPWPTTAAQAQAWQFNADAQTWTMP